MKRFVGKKQGFVEKKVVFFNKQLLLYFKILVMKKKYIVTLHVLFWLYYMLQEVVYFKPETQTFSIPILTFDFHIPGVAIAYSMLFLYVFVFYLNYLYVLPRFFDIKNAKRLLFAFAGLFAVFIGLRYLIEEVLYLEFLGFHNYYDGVTIPYYIYDNIHYGSQPIVASSVLWLIINMLRLQKKQIELMESKRETEINFLKSQINPHFIFNTLNNIYYLVFEKSDKSLKAIEQLSGLMRYMTYESANETIAICREIDYIEDFIQLESMRISGKANILFEKDIRNSEFRIPPLLLIPFVENGFKHGIVNDENRPFTIKLSQTDQLLLLETENGVNQYQKDHSPGVGIENIKKRLALYFPDRHTLNITSQNDLYQVHLTIQL